MNELPEKQVVDQALRIIHEQLIPDLKLIPGELTGPLVNQFAMVKPGTACGDLIAMQQGLQIRVVTLCSQ